MIVELGFCFDWWDVADLWMQASVVEYFTRRVGDGLAANVENSELSEDEAMQLAVEEVRAVRKGTRAAYRRRDSDDAAVGSHQGGDDTDSCPASFEEDSYFSFMSYLQGEFGFATYTG